MPITKAGGLPSGPLIQTEEKSGGSLLRRATSSTGCTVYAATDKVNDVVKALFRMLNKFFQSISQSIWPEKKVVERREKLGHVAGVIKDAFEQVETGEVSKVKTRPMNKFLTYAYEAAVILAPISLSIGGHSPESSFIKKQGTAQVALDGLQPTIKEFFGEENLDMEQLNAHGMILKSDSIDHTVYQFGTFTFAAAANTLTLGILNPPLHLIFSSIAGLPPVENAIMGMKVPKYISEVAHKIGNESRAIVKSCVINLAKPRMITAADRVEKAALNAVNNPTLPDLGKTGNLLVKALIQKHIKKPASDKLANVIDQVTNTVADRVIDLTINRIHGLVTNTIQLHFMNKALQTAYMTNPLFAGVSIVMTGGMEQSIGELAIRTAGAALFCMTGQVMWPIIFVYGPPVVDYLLEVVEAGYKVLQDEEGLLLEALAIANELDPSVKIEEVFEEDSTPDPLGFMGGHHFEPVEQPKPIEIDPVKQAAYHGILGLADDEIVVNEEAPSILDSLITSIFATKVVDEEAPNFFIGR